MLKNRRYAMLLRLIVDDMFDSDSVRVLVFILVLVLVGMEREAGMEVEVDTCVRESRR